MFVRKKKNRSGSVTVVVVDKSRGQFREVHNFGTSSDMHKVEELCKEAKSWILNHDGQGVLDLWPEERLVSQTEIFNRITAIRQDVPYRILEQIYDSVGFDKVGDKILKDLAIARVCCPKSKVATVDYMRQYWGEAYQYQSIYRYLDALYNKKKEQVLQISVDHTRKILGGAITVAFYDVTTLYFNTTGSGLWNAHSVFQKAHLICARCFTSRRKGLKLMSACVLWRLNFTKSWNDY